MLLKSCARCGNLIPYGATYCSTCEPIVREQRERRLAEYRAKAQANYNRKRDPKYTTFYSSKDWRTLSRKYAQDHGFRCELCGQIATEVHHKDYIQTPSGWERRLDYDNLELLCVTCHNKRHERFKSKKSSEK